MRIQYDSTSLKAAAQSQGSDVVYDCSLQTRHSFFEDREHTFSLCVVRYLSSSDFGTSASGCKSSVLIYSTSDHLRAVGDCQKKVMA